MMKSILVISLALLCSCNKPIETKNNVKRYDAINKLMGREYCTVRGPLAVSQVETELIESYEHITKDMPNSVKYEDTLGGEQWAWLKSQYVEGDEFYLFRSRFPKRSGSGEGGVEGYILVRGNEIIGRLVTMRYTM